MTSDNKLELDGLKFVLLPKKPENIINTLYRTGDEIEFILSVQNKSVITKHGKLPIVYRYGVGYGHPISAKIFTLKPTIPNGYATFVINIPSKIEGNVLITMPTIESTESLEDVTDEVITSKIQNAPYEVIYSLHIMDRGVYDQQKNRDEMLIKKLDSLPKIILDEVDRRINITKDEIMEEIKRQMPERDSINIKEIKPKESKMEAIK